MDPRSAELLELPAVRRRLAGLTSFAGGRDLALELVPSPEPERVAARLAETEEALRLRDLGIGGPGGASDLRPATEAAARDAALEVEALAEVLATVRVWLEAREAVAAQAEEAPRLAAALAAPDAGAARRVEAALERALDPRGGLLDTASPELASVRRRLASARRAASELLRALAARLRSHLQESFTTERGGRPVLAVKASSRSAVPGIVHDSSGSGQTLFIEPMELVEASNRVRELAAEEAEEEARIVRALSRLVGDEREPLDDLTAALAELDLALARAALSRAWAGCRVEPAGEVELRAARHPLLEPASAVPIDLPLEGVRALVVSGPNTGGKTVALKTLGLLAMLHQCGLRVPAARARLPVFDRVLADIGDDQSIAESLSTFSAHVRRLIAILAAAGPRSLVLLDEPAAGTDPDEGARLAEAVVERLVEQGALVLATTHHPELKAWASGAPRAANAAVGLDARTLRPLYALQIGEPGASHALGIAEGLGLDPGSSRPRARRGRPSGAPWRRCCRRRPRPGRRPTTSAPRPPRNAPRRPRPAAAPRPARPSSSAAWRAPARPRRPRAPRRAARPRPSWPPRRGSSRSCGPRSRPPGARRPPVGRRRPPRPPRASVPATAASRPPRGRRAGLARSWRRSRRRLRPTGGRWPWATRSSTPRWASAGAWCPSTAGGPRCREAEPGCGCRSRAWWPTRRPRRPRPSPRSRRSRPRLPPAPRRPSRSTSGGGARPTRSAPCASGWTRRRWRACRRSA